MKSLLHQSIRAALPTIMIGCLVSASVVASGSSPSPSPPPRQTDSPEDQEAGKKEEAIKKYNKGVEHMTTGKEKGAEKDSTFAFNYRATPDKKAEKEFKKAAKEFEKAVKLDPTMKEAHNNLGYCYRKLDRLEKSLASYQRALKLDPKFEQAREYLGETYLALGELTKAKEEFYFLKGLKSAYADTLSLAIQLYQLKELDEAMTASGR